MESSMPSLPSRSLFSERAVSHSIRILATPLQSFAVPGLSSLRLSKRVLFIVSGL